MFTVNDASERRKEGTEDTRCSEQQGSHTWSPQSRSSTETEMLGFVGQGEVGEGK